MGLVAFIELEKVGFALLILEATNCVVGQLKSDWESKMPIDPIFQVLPPGSSIRIGKVISTRQ